MMKIYINKDENVEKVNECIEKWKETFNSFFEQKDILSLKSLSSSMMIIRFENIENTKKPYFVVYSFYDNSLSIPSGGKIFLDLDKETGYSTFIDALFWLIKNEEFLDMLYEYTEEIQSIKEDSEDNYDEEIDDDSSSSY